MGRTVYLPTNFPPTKSTIHVGKLCQYLGSNGNTFSHYVYQTIPILPTAASGMIPKKREKFWVFFVPNWRIAAHHFQNNFKRSYAKVMQHPLFFIASFGCLRCLHLHACALPWIVGGYNMFCYMFHNVPAPFLFSTTWPFAEGGYPISTLLASVLWYWFLYFQDPHPSTSTKFREANMMPQDTTKLWATCRHKCCWVTFYWLQLGYMQFKYGDLGCFRTA